jgi:hypothetical protein
MEEPATADAVVVVVADDEGNVESTNEAAAEVSVLGSHEMTKLKHLLMTFK